MGASQAVRTRPGFNSPRGNPFGHFLHLLDLGTFWGRYIRSVKLEGRLTFLHGFLSSQEAVDETEGPALCCPTFLPR
jgi:hypothetical protein